MDGAPLPLTCFACGVCVKLVFMSLAPDAAQRLRELGVREGNQIHILKNETSFVCGIEACRVALRREMAMQVFGIPVQAA